MAAMLATVNYKGTLDDGTVFDESTEPFAFVEGTRSVIKGFEDAVAGLEPGQKVSVHIEPADAYGDYDEHNVQMVPTSMIPNADQLPIGERVFFRNPAGAAFPALIQKIEDGNVYIDFNHELAGKALNFEIELISREEAPEDMGCPGCSGCGHTHGNGEGCGGCSGC